MAENKFTGKERDEEHGLNWDFFGARYYDSEIGRWMVRDPLAEKHPEWSPYNYVLNNPLILIDPDGKQIAIHWFVAGQHFKENPQHIWLVAGMVAAAFGLAFAPEIAAPIITAALSKPVQTNQIGLAIVEAAAPGAENLSLGAAGKIAGEGIDAVRTLSKADDFATSLKSRVAIGKAEDLAKPGVLKSGERLLDLPDQGSPKLNWEQNASRLREAMREGLPIRDISVDPKIGALDKNTGFLQAERNLLRNHDWQYDPKTNYWDPPKK